MSSIDRILDLAGGDDAARVPAKALAVRRWLLLYLLVDAWFRYGAKPEHELVELSFALLLTLAAGFGMFERWSRAASEIAAVAVLAEVAWTFPATETHLYLAALAALIVVLFDLTKEPEAAAALSGLRWVVILALFWSGLQKLVHGYWFDATVVGQLVGYDVRFKQFFAWLLPADEHLRLVRQFWPGSLDRGPWSVRSPLVVALGNAAWILQLAVPVGLLATRLRRTALTLGLVVVLAAVIVTREVFYAALLSYLLLLFTPRDLNRKLLPLYGLLFAGLLLIAAGILPRMDIR